MLRAPLISLRTSQLIGTRLFHLHRAAWNKDPFGDLQKSPQRPLEPATKTAVRADPTRTIEAKENEANPKIQAIVSRLPKFMQKYGQRIVNAPMTHISSFLLLHEFTAIAPLFGLWYVFHHYGFLPADIPSWMLMKGTTVIEGILGDTVSGLSIPERTRLIVEGATAYGIVKATFPVRVVFSIFMTPWFARVFVEPGLHGLQRLFSLVRGKKK